MQLVRFMLIIASFTLLVNPLISQDNYWVFLSDKDGVTFNPYSYFDQKAIDRRMELDLPLDDFTDRPIREDYQLQINELADSLLGESRWFNAMAIRANTAQISQIALLKFVTQIQPMTYRSKLAQTSTEQALTINKGAIPEQISSMGYSYFNEANIDGKGVRVAIFDGGFPGVNTIEALKHIRDDNRLLKTWDFTKNKEDVFYGIQHGTNVMSNIGGMYLDGNPIGLATGAEYMLAKTEINREPYIEEVHWLSAVEWADKNGADIINSSLGYTTDRYFQEDMIGTKSLVSRAANLAARKGILVVNAAGNEGSDEWEVIGTPADADSVLSIGGVDPSTLIHISFSSYGPTANGTLKPNVCAFGTATVATKNGGYTSASGTSFSSPLVAGFAACAMQVKPELNNMEIFHLIEKSGHLYPYFDYAHGYGIPQANYILNQSKDSIPVAFELSQDGDEVFADLLYPTNFQVGSSRYIYTKIYTEAGKVLKYKVLKINNQKAKLFGHYEMKEIRNENSENLIIEAYYSGCIRKISHRIPISE